MGKLNLKGAVGSSCGGWTNMCVQYTINYKNRRKGTRDINMDKWGVVYTGVRVIGIRPRGLGA